MYRKNTDMNIGTYTPIHLHFHSVQCIWDIVRVKDSFNFLFVSDSWTILVLLLYTEIIAILDWMHEGVN